MTIDPVTEAAAKAIFVADHEGSEPEVLELAWTGATNWDPRPKYRRIATAALVAIDQTLVAQTQNW